MLSFKKKNPLACLGAAKGMKRHTRVDTYASSLKKLTAWSSNKKGGSWSVQVRFKTYQHFVA